MMIRLTQKRRQDAKNRHHLEPRLTTVSNPVKMLLYLIVGSDPNLACWDRLNRFSNLLKIDGI